jgi:amidohydrolase
MDAVMPTLERLVGKDAIVDAPPGLGYDDVSVFVKAFGGLYFNYGVQEPGWTP